MSDPEEYIITIEEHEYRVVVTHELREQLSGDNHQYRTIKIKYNGTYDRDGIKPKWTRTSRHVINISFEEQFANTLDDAIEYHKNRLSADRDIGESLANCVGEENVHGKL